MGRLCSVKCSAHFKRVFNKLKLDCNGEDSVSRREPEIYQQPWVYIWMRQLFNHATIQQIVFNQQTFTGGLRWTSFQDDMEPMNRLFPNHEHGNNRDIMYSQ